MRRQVGLEIFDTPDILRYSLLSSLCNLAENGLPEYSVVLELADDQKVGARKLVLDTLGATSFKLPCLSSVGGIVLSIRCIRDQGWEGLNYHVMESENDLFEWYCREVLLFVEP